MASGISPPPPMMAASAATMLASAYATQTEVDQSGGGNLELSQEPNTTDPVKVKVGKSLHRLNFPVLTSSFRPLFDLPDAPSAVPPTSSEWVPGRPVPKPWRF